MKNVNVMHIIKSIVMAIICGAAGVGMLAVVSHFYYENAYAHTSCTADELWEAIAVVVATLMMHFVYRKIMKAIEKKEFLKEIGD